MFLNIEIYCLIMKETLRNINDILFCIDKVNDNNIEDFRYL